MKKQKITYAEAENLLDKVYEKAQKEGDFDVTLKDIDGISYDIDTGRKFLYNTNGTVYHEEENPSAFFEKDEEGKLFFYGKEMVIELTLRGSKIIDHPFSYAEI